MGLLWYRRRSKHILLAADSQKHCRGAEARGVPYQDARIPGEPAAVVHEQHHPPLLPPDAGDAAGPPGRRASGGLPQDT